MKKALVSVIAIAGIMVLAASSAMAKPLKVYILAGQSNMQGMGGVNTFDHIGEDPATVPMLKEMRGPDGKPRVCENAWIAYGDRKGRLTAGYGADPGRIGPEFTFGIYIQKHLKEPILLIKTAWGGKSLSTDFRPPSAGPYRIAKTTLDRMARQSDGAKRIEAFKAERSRKTGRNYRLMMKQVKDVLADIGSVYPGYDPRSGYEVAGFVWFQGWNDSCDSVTYPDRNDPNNYDHYTELMAHFIRDVRTELKAPNMRFVIGTLGVHGKNADTRMKNFRRAQAAAAEMPEFKGNVAVVRTEEYWIDELNTIEFKFGDVRQMRNRLRSKSKGGPNQDGTMTPQEQKAYLKEFRKKVVSPAEEALWARATAHQGYHYFGSAKIMGQIGKAFADAIARMEKK